MLFKEGLGPYHPYKTFYPCAQSRVTDMLWAGQALPGPKGLKGRRQTGDGVRCWLPPRTEQGALKISSLLSKPWCQFQFGIMTLKGNRVIKLGWLGHRKTDKSKHYGASGPQGAMLRMSTRI